MRVKQNFMTENIQNITTRQNILFETDQLISKIHEKGGKQKLGNGKTDQ